LSGGFVTVDMSAGGHRTVTSNHLP